MRIEADRLGGVAPERKLVWIGVRLQRNQHGDHGGQNSVRGMQYFSP
jgi:hypothetical protein